MFYVLNTDGVTDAAGVVIAGPARSLNDALAIYQHQEANARRGGFAPPPMRIVEAASQVPQGALLRKSDVLEEHELD